MYACRKPSPSGPGRLRPPISASSKSRLVFLAAVAAGVAVVTGKQLPVQGEELLVQFLLVGMSFR
jgi:hypothetical protein